MDSDKRETSRELDDSMLENVAGGTGGNNDNVVECTEKAYCDVCKEFIMGKLIKINGRTEDFYCPKCENRNLITPIINVFTNEEVWII